MMKRRDFVKTGTLGLSFVAGSGWALSFNPADVQGLVTKLVSSEIPQGM